MSKLVLKKETKLPVNWILTNIGTICYDSQYGWTTSASNIGKIKFLRTTDITHGKINWDTVPFCKEIPNDLEKYLLKKNDVVISRAGSIGFSYLLDDVSNTVFASYLIRFNPLINPKFFYYFLQSPFYWKAISEKKIGIAVQNVNATKLKQIMISLPSLNEQKRIVEKIDELFSLIDGNNLLLKKTSIMIKNYTKMFSEQAFNGFLTQSWRKQNSNLVLEEQEEQKKFLLKCNVHFSKNVENNYPVEWLEVNFDVLMDTVKNGLTKRRSDKGIDTPVIRLIDVKDGKILENNFRKIKLEPKELYKYLLEKDELLCTRVNGSEDLVGRMSVCPSQKLWAFADHFIAYKPHKSLVSSNFISQFFNTGRVREFIRLNKVSSAGQNTVSQKTLSQILVPLPTMPEQLQIINELELSKSISERFSFLVLDCLKQNSKLIQSILAMAFEGKLVPQDPKDESAEILLQKIKQEKEQLKQKEKSKKEKNNGR